MGKIVRALLLSAALLGQVTFAHRVAHAADAALPPELANLDEQGQADAMRFMTGNVVYVLFHEAGHMLVSELDLPVLGREEDAVDTLSSVLLLEAKDAELDQALMDSVASWLNLGNDYEIGEQDFMDTHALSKQRAYNIACMMVGQDPVRFKAFADGLALPQSRREECEGEYQKARDSWFSVLKPYLADDKDKIDFKIAYQADGDGKLGFYRDTLKDIGVLEMLRDTFSGLVTLKGGITLTAATCGQANAFWSPDERTLTYCYEDAQSYITSFAEHGASPAASAAAAPDDQTSEDDTADSADAQDEDSGTADNATAGASGGSSGWVGAKFGTE